MVSVVSLLSLEPSELLDGGIKLSLPLSTFLENPASYLIQKLLLLHLCVTFGDEGTFDMVADIAAGDTIGDRIIPAFRLWDDMVYLQGHPSFEIIKHGTTTVDAPIPVLDVDFPVPAQRFTHPPTLPPSRRRSS